MTEEINCYELKALESAKFLNEYCRNFIECAPCIFFTENILHPCALSKAPDEYDIRVKVEVE